MDKSWKPIEDRKIWNAFILDTSLQSLFQIYEWGEVQKLLGITLYRYGLYEDKKLVSASQIAVVPTKLGSFLHVRHGPVSRVWDDTFLSSFHTLVLPLSKKHKAFCIRISPLLDDEAYQKIFEMKGYVPSAIHAMDAEQCRMLDLTKSENEILAGMRKTTRYEVRHAEKLGIRVVQSKDPADVSKFLSLYKKTSTRHGFVEHKGIAQEVEVFSKYHMCSLFFGIYGNVILSAAVILYVGNQAIYHHGASVLTKIPASYAVQWAAITEAKKRGAAVYNFWGVSPEEDRDHPWAGLSLFKRGFGGYEKSYMHAHDYPTSPVYPLFRMTERIRKSLKGYT